MINLRVIWQGFRHLLSKQWIWKTCLLLGFMWATIFQQLFGRPYLPWLYNYLFISYRPYPDSYLIFSFLTLLIVISIIIGFSNRYARYTFSMLSAFYLFELEYKIFSTMMWEVHTGKNSSVFSLVLSLLFALLLSLSFLWARFSRKEAIYINAVIVMSACMGAYHTYKIWLNYQK